MRLQTPVLGGALGEDVRLLGAHNASVYNATSTPPVAEHHSVREPHKDDTEGKKG